jgi:LysR family glycine cleavage system transcriptional activator
LTNAGAAFFRDLSAGFDRLQAATERLLEVRERRAVTITTTPVFAIKWLIPRMADFYVSHPDIEVRVSTSYRVLNLAQEDYDLGVRWGSGKWPGVNAEKLMGESFMPVCSPQFLKKHGPLRKPADVLGSRLIHQVLGQDPWKVWAALYGLPSPNAAMNLQFREMLGAIQASIAGLGIALGPASVVHDDLAVGTLVAPIKESVALADAYFLVEPERHNRNPATTAFRTWLIETCRKFEAAQRKARFRLKPGAIPYPMSQE